MENLVCPSCGAPVSDGAKFCRSCGTPLAAAAPAAEEPAAASVCSACGAPLAEGMRFCMSCGAPASAPAAAAAPVYEEGGTTLLNEEPQYAQPVYEQPVYEEPAAKPKKKKGPIAAIIAAVCALAVLGGGYLFCFDMIAAKIMPSVALSRAVNASVKDVEDMLDGSLLGAVSEIKGALSNGSVEGEFALDGAEVPASAVIKLSGNGSALSGSADLTAGTEKLGGKVFADSAKAAFSVGGETFGFTYADFDANIDKSGLSSSERESLRSFVKLAKSMTAEEGAGLEGMLKDFLKNHEFKAESASMNEQVLASTVPAADFEALAAALFGADAAFDGVKGDVEMTVTIADGALASVDAKGTDENGAFKASLGFGEGVTAKFEGDGDRSAKLSLTGGDGKSSLDAECEGMLGDMNVSFDSSVSDGSFSAEYTSEKNGKEQKAEAEGTLETKGGVSLTLESLTLDGADDITLTGSVNTSKDGAPEAVPAGYTDIKDWNSATFSNVRSSARPLTGALTSTLLRIDPMLAVSGYVQNTLGLIFDKLSARPLQAFEIFANALVNGTLEGTVTLAEGANAFNGTYKVTGSSDTGVYGAYVGFDITDGTETRGTNMMGYLDVNNFLAAVSSPLIPNGEVIGVSKDGLLNSSYLEDAGIDTAMLEEAFNMLENPTEAEVPAFIEPLTADLTAYSERIAAAFIAQINTESEINDDGTAQVTFTLNEEGLYAFCDFLASELPGMCSDLYGKYFDDIYDFVAETLASLEEYGAAAELPSKDELREELDTAMDEMPEVLTEAAETLRNEAVGTMNVTVTLALADNVIRRADLYIDGEFDGYYESANAWFELTGDAENINMGLVAGEVNADVNVRLSDDGTDFDDGISISYYDGWDNVYIETAFLWNKDSGEFSLGGEVSAYNFFSFWIPGNLTCTDDSFELILDLAEAFDGSGMAQSFDEFVLTVSANGQSTDVTVPDFTDIDEWDENTMQAIEAAALGLEEIFALGGGSSSSGTVSGEMRYLPLPDAPYGYYPLSGESGFECAWTPDQFYYTATGITPGAYEAEIETGYYYAFVFRPAESGTYTFRSFGHTADPWCELYDAEGYSLSYSDDHDGYDFRVECYLEAGEDYTFVLGFYSVENDTVFLELTKEGSSVGEYAYEYLDMSGAFNDFIDYDGSGTVLYEILYSNLYDLYSDYSFIFGGIVPNTEYSFTLDASERAALLFRPEVSGTYRLESANTDLDPWCNVYDSDDYIIASNDYYSGLDFRVEPYLEAGEAYYFIIGFYSDYTDDVTFRFTQIG